MKNRPDYLNRPEHERRLLTQKEDNPAQKAEPDKLQFPLVRVVEGKSFIMARISCDSCGEITNDAKEYQIVFALMKGCGKCGAGTEVVRVVDVWE